MRQTFTDLISLSQNLAGKDTSTAAQTFFKQRINGRYETTLAKLPSHFSEITKTFPTVATQQYYHYPPNMKEMENIYITIGSRDYPLTPEISYAQWTKLNAIDFQAGAIPNKFFKRQRDFGIWPIPQAIYTSTLTYTLRAGGMVYSDYVTGTVTVTENDATVIGAGGASWSSSNVVGDIMWFALADTNGEPRGDWYRVLSLTDGTNLELESVFEGATVAGASYIIGESPELPEELHEVLAYGAVADYYAGFRQSLSKAQAWNNMYWTGDFDNNSRDLSNNDISGGLLGFLKDNQARHNSQLIKRTTTTRRNKIWASTLSDS